MRKMNYSLSGLLLIISIVAVPALYSQQDSRLRITSPENGTLVFAGESVTVSVVADPSLGPTFVLAEQPLSNAQPTSKLNTFLLTVPEKVSPGSYAVTVIAVKEGRPVADRIELHLEMKDDPYGLRADPFYMSLKPGDKYPLRIEGTFQQQVDGKFLNDFKVDLTNSSKIEFDTNKPEVAFVDKDRMINAVGPGQVAITVSYPNKDQGHIYVPVVVEVSKPIPVPTGPKPAISRVTPGSGVPSETQVEVVGSAFGDNQGAGYLQIGNRNGIVISWSDTRIVAKVAEYTASGVVEVTQNEQHSNSVPFKILSPVILGYGPIPIFPGMTITIRGQEFGKEETGFVTFQDTRAKVVSWTETEIVVVVPDELISGQIHVHQGRYTSNFVNFRIMPPQTQTK